MTLSSVSSATWTKWVIGVLVTIILAGLTAAMSLRQQDMDRLLRDQGVQILALSATKDDLSAQAQRLARLEAAQEAIKELMREAIAGVRQQMQESFATVRADIADLKRSVNHAKEP